MSEPRPPATPPPVQLETATGEWSSGTDRDPVARAANPTLTNSGTGPTIDELGIPNPFGRYAITKLLGRGGMGAVFLATDSQLERPVAIKVPTFRGKLTATQKERFFREARAIAALRHPNICPVFDVDEEQGFLFLTMAYIEGQSLSAVIERGPMQPPEAVDLIRRVARAMHVAHIHGTIHRDLKPANILIDKNGEPVVMDFGLARRAHWGEETRTDATGTVSNDTELTQDGSVLGTPAYMPPEQARGDMAAIGTRSDIYSLGVILYELLTGRRPFVADDTADLIRQIGCDPPPKPTEFYPWIDRSVESTCLKALAKDPADRFSSMAQFEEALKEAVEPELRVVVPPPLPPATPKKSRPVPKKSRGLRKVLTCLTVVMLLLTMCVGAPTAAIWWLIVKTSDKIKDFSDSFQRSEAEWDAITKLWVAPPADADTELLLPPTFGDGKYHRIQQDASLPDPELGINLAGRRGTYRGPDGEVSINVYRCTDAEARAIEDKAYQFAQGRLRNPGPAPNSTRYKAVYAANRSDTVTFGFHDSQSQKQEYGKLWYSSGWLFWFQTATPLEIEFFPPKFVIEVGKRTPPPDAKKSSKGSTD
ncbi:MAG TPA: serine/threonine-protein kinase [Gemmataceae bacterium]|jgi:serine/threonine protein kinase|nr:serine/threonine-protein kinase [Gemmataceae bacterium]